MVKTRSVCRKGVNGGGAALQGGKMAYYCKRCNVANYENVCECCGKKNLPEVEPCDPCFIVELSNYLSRIYEEALENKGIKSFLVPSGFDLVTRANSDMKIYVPYKDIDEALDIYEAIFFPQNNSQDNSQDNQNHNSQDNSQGDGQGDLKDDRNDDNAKER